MASDGDKATDVKRGVVVSDLHVFAKRSRADRIMGRVYEELERADVLVLNGDTFDLRWTTLPTTQETVMASVRWLKELMEHAPHCEFHLVLGNHDCHADLVSALDALADESPSFSWHEYYVRLGNALFLHGDCAQRSMTAEGLSEYREPWRRVSKRAPVFGLLYELMDQMGVTVAVHRLFFPRRKIAQRILAYLNDVAPGLVDKIDHVYFGHTHLPLTRYKFNGVRFHNSGSAVNRMKFKALRFEVSDL